MNKVSFFRSIHFKFTLIYVLLIIVAMQIIGVYFVNEMEKSLLKSYNDSLDQRVNNLSYYLEQEMTKDRSTSSSTTLKEDAERILNDFSKEGEILEVSLIDKSYEVIATSNPYNREVAGKKTTEGIIKRTLLVGIPYENKFFDPERDSKVRISVTPIKNRIKRRSGPFMSWHRWIMSTTKSGRSTPF